MSFTYWNVGTVVVFKFVKGAVELYVIDEVMSIFPKINWMKYDKI